MAYTNDSWGLSHYQKSQGNRSSRLKLLPLPLGEGYDEDDYEASFFPLPPRKSSTMSSPEETSERKEVTIDHIIEDLAQLSLVNNKYDKAENQNRVPWTPFPMEQVEELRSAIAAKSSKVIESVTMFASNGLARFLVVDAVLPQDSEGDAIKRIDSTFFDLKDGEMIFTKPLVMGGDERAYAVSKAKALPSAIEDRAFFKLILKRVHATERTIAQMSEFHPMQELPILEPYRDHNSTGLIFIKAVSGITYKDDLNSGEIVAWDSIDASDVSVTKAHYHDDGSLDLVYAYPNPNFDLDARTQEIYNSESKAFKFIHVRLKAYV